MPAGQHRAPDRHQCGSRHRAAERHPCRLASIGHLTDTSAEAVIEQLNAIHADGIDMAVNEYVITADFVRTLHEAGKTVAIWTVDQPGQAKRMIEAGVDAITSNRAAKLRDLLSRK